MAKIWLKYLILLLYIVLLIVIGSLIGFFGPYKCTRKACVRKAKYILSNMNQNVNPCNNFYKFSCENYHHIVAYRKGGVASPLDHIKYDIEEEIDKILKTPLRVTDDRILKIVKKMYQPCVNNDLINLQGVEPLWDAIWMTGGFPVVDGDDWNEKSFSIETLEYKSRKNGFKGRHIFDSFIAKDKRNGKLAIHIKPPSFKKLAGNELVTENYTKKLHDYYLSFIVRLTFHLLNKTNYEQDDQKVIRERFENELNQSMTFKIELIQHLRDYWKDQDPIELYNPMTLEKLQIDFSYINWKHYFKNMLPSSVKVPKEIVVIGTSFFKGIKELLKKTPKRNIANFVMLENVLEASLFLPGVFFAIYNKFKANIGLSISTRVPFCEEVVKETMKGALSSIFLQTYNLTEGSQPILEEMARQMQKEIKKSIESLTWMDDKTKEAAILKLNKMKFTLSLSDDQLNELHNVEARAKYFEDLCLGSRISHVLPNYFCINKFFSKKNWELLSRKLTVFDEDIDVFSPEIKYIQEKNELLVPYSVLKYPAFDGVWPGYLNYGGIGSDLGVVFTHGYDLIGSKNNEMGFRNQWWTARTKGLYKQHCQCFDEEYVKFAKESSNITLKRAVRDQENVADFEGINLAYYAYSNYLDSRYLKERSLPGLERFTAKQLFFIGYANMYCSFYKKKKAAYILRYGIEVRNDFKVISSLQNFKEFSDTFECKYDDHMNPHKKCKMLW